MPQNFKKILNKSLPRTTLPMYVRHGTISQFFLFSPRKKNIKINKTIKIFSLSLY